MRLGIDFGTTRIVAAAVDRGNYPVVSFETPDGSSAEWFPPWIAAAGDDFRFGWAAWERQQEPGWTFLRSIKRSLSAAGPDTAVAAGGRQLPMSRLLAGLMAELRDALLHRSSLNPKAGEALEVMLGTPANANTNQRFLTADAFRAAGFEVLGLLNEPSAASIEFGHRYRPLRERRRLLVYDFGGGTFDASLVEMQESEHNVLASEGIPTLGGDDFDLLLAELAFEVQGLGAAEWDSLSQAETFRLLEECRARKEALHPNTRKLLVDLDAVREGWGTAAVPVPDFYERCAPLIEETLHAVEDLLDAHQGRELVDALYVTGGASELPLVPRALRERFGRRVKRSAHTRSATAIGLAIQADQQSGYRLRERFARHFGVWREAEDGRSVVFDALFTKGTPLPAPGEPPLEIRRCYRPVHNVGHFRYLECGRRAENGQPCGELTLWDEIRFPFDPALRERPLDEVEVRRTEAASAQIVEEVYSCDASAAVRVEIHNRTAGYSRAWRLARWAPPSAPIVPGRRRKSAR